MSDSLPVLELSTNTVSSVDQLKSLLGTLLAQSTVLKSIVLSVKNVIKDVEKQSKDLEKFRNKKNRIKTQRKEDAQPSGITKPVAISDELASFLGVQPGTLVPRNEVTKGVSDYIRKNELYDPANRQRFLLQSKPEGVKLWELLGKPEDGITYFNLQRYLKPHYIKVPSEEVLVTKEVPPEVPTESSEPKKKKILVKKKKEVLNEEV